MATMAATHFFHSRHVSFSGDNNISKFSNPFAGGTLKQSNYVNKCKGVSSGQRGYNNMRRSCVIKASSDARKQVEIVYNLDEKLNRLADEVDMNAGLSRLTLFSPCKINVFLRITDKRPDGFHDLASLFHVISLGDKIKFSLSPSKSTDRLSTNVAGIPLDERNLIIKALNLYRKKTGSDKYFWIHVDKRVPTGAGLGGGSSNAATALWAANQFSGGLATEKELQEWSGEIGSDVPFFFSNGAAYCTGRGEIVQDIPSPVPFDLPMVLIKPPEAFPCHKASTKPVTTTEMEGGIPTSSPTGSYSNGHHQNGTDHVKPWRSHHGGGGSGGSRSRRVNREIEAPPCTDFDKAYFQSYSHVGIHEEMIKDRVRTETYRMAVLQHQKHIEGKVVVDVGCGTGILSIFCAQAGAKHVYAVDASEIALQANEVVKANKLSDRITVLHGRVEDVQIDEEVDVIISEWMGYMLLYESMLGSVIIARDRWLRPGGLILPSNAVLYMAPITHPNRYAESVDFWRNVYGIDMSPIVPLAKQCAFEEPSVETISGENVLTWPHVVKHVDCYTVTVKELESVTASFKFQSMMRAPFNGFAFWFDVEFSGPANAAAPSSADEATKTNPSVGHRRKRANPDEALVLSTAPEDPPTHWQQTMVYFYEPIDVEQDQVIDGSVTLTQSKENARFMNIHLEYASGGRSFVKESVLR